MWHNTWLSNGAGANAASDLPDGYTEPENLGGNFTSAPFAFATSESRIDVLGVGGDDRLKHKVRVDGVWAQEWQDLGGYFNSAPVEPSSISVFRLGPNGTVIHGIFEMNNDATWKEGSWFTDGGIISTDGYRLTTA